MLPYQMKKRKTHFSLNTRLNMQNREYLRSSLFPVEALRMVASVLYLADGFGTASPMLSDA